MWWWKRKCNKTKLYVLGSDKPRWSVWWIFLLSLTNFTIINRRRRRISSAYVTSSERKRNKKFNLMNWAHCRSPLRWHNEDNFTPCLPVTQSTITSHYNLGFSAMFPGHWREQGELKKNWKSIPKRDRFGAMNILRKGWHKVVMMCYLVRVNVNEILS